LEAWTIILNPICRGSGRLDTNSPARGDARRCPFHDFSPEAVDVKSEDAEIEVDNF